MPQKRDLDMPEQSKQAANAEQKDPAVVAAAVRAKLDKVLEQVTRRPSQAVATRCAPPPR